MVNMVISLSLLHAGYKEGHCKQLYKTMIEILHKHTSSHLCKQKVEQ